MALLPILEVPDPRLRTRAGLVAKRSSVAQSGTPAKPQNFSNWLSLPTARMKKPSEQRTTE